MMKKSNLVSSNDNKRISDSSNPIKSISSRTENLSSNRVLRAKPRSSSELYGSRVSVFKEYGGLGKRYYDRLGRELDRILQVDVVTSVTETKGSVRGRSIKLALEMKDRGVVENDIVVIYSRNHADQTIVVLATLFLGAIVAPLDPEFSYKVCLEIIKKLKPKMCFTDARTISQIERILSTLSYNTEIINFSEETSGVSQFKKMLNHKEDELFRPTFVEDAWKAVAFILPTQGTTGDPKLICLSHHNICVQTMIYQDILDYPDKVLSFFPLSWLLQTILTCLCFEASTTRIIPGPFSERSACKIIHDFKIGHAIFGTDYAMKLVNNVAIKDFDMNCLKCVMIGIVNTTKFDIKTLKTLMPHVKFLQNYCLTETGCIAATKFRNYEVSLDKHFSVGTLSINSKVRVVDLETKEVLGPGKYGEIYFNGDGMMLGYFKDPEKTIGSIERGFFKTGDIGMYDEDGWLYVKGRIEDLIVMDSITFYPMELEDVILRHPFVKDVVVIGNDKELVAVVKKKEERELTIDKLQKFISEKTTEKYMPSRIVFLDHFPRTTIGSVKKTLLREDLLQVRIHYTSSLASITTK